MTTSTKGFHPTYQKGGPDWFCRLKGADFDVDDCPREGRTKTFEDGKLEELFDDVSNAGAVGFGIRKPAKRLQELGMIHKQGTWILYDLKPTDAERRFSFVNNCSSGKKEGLSSLQRDG